MAMTDYETKSLLLLSVIAQGIGLQLVGLNPEMRNNWGEVFTEQVQSWLNNHHAVISVISSNSDDAKIKDMEADPE